MAAGLHQLIAALRGGFVAGLGAYAFFRRALPVGFWPACIGGWCYPLTAFLATIPGGLDAIAIIAVDSNADISFVLALQTVRLFVVIVTGPMLAKLICRLV